MHRQRLRAHGTTDRMQTPKGFAKAHPTEYRAYSNMKNRCYNPKNQAYKNYGERGIKVCDRWLGPDGFVNFLNDMGKRPSKDLSLDRIDVNGDYCPENCRWATQGQQANNRRTNTVIAYRGETKTISEWAKELNIGTTTLHARLFKHKWPVERALTTPPSTEINRSLTELSRKHGIDRLTVWKRLRRGWSLEDALNRPKGYHICKKNIKYKGVEKPLTDWCRELDKDYDTVVKRLKYGWTPEEAFTLEKDKYIPRAKRKMPK